MTLAYIVSNSGIINLVAKNKNFTITQAHPHYEKIKKGLGVKDENYIYNLADVVISVSKLSHNEVEIKDGQVFYRGQVLHNSLTNRILELMEREFPFKFMLCFLENLMQNSSAQSVKELYDFLSHKNLPITEDGHFLAYKGVMDNYFDRYTGTINNSVGQIVEMERNQVDDDRRHECSYGYHVGTLEYVKTYCTDNVMIVKVNPKDCVSVPLDHNAQKLRVCKYEVVGQYTGDLSVGLDESPVYNSDVTPYEIDTTDNGYDNDVYDYEDYTDCDSDCDDCNSYCNKKEEMPEFGVKRDGSFYYNKRNAQGRFTK